MENYWKDSMNISSCSPPGREAEQPSSSAVFYEEPAFDDNVLDFLTGEIMKDYEPSTSPIHATAAPATTVPHTAPVLPTTSQPTAKESMFSIKINEADKKELEKFTKIFDEIDGNDKYLSSPTSSGYQTSPPYHFPASPRRWSSHDSSPQQQPPQPYTNYTYKNNECGSGFANEVKNANPPPAYHEYVTPMKQPRFHHQPVVAAAPPLQTQNITAAQSASQASHYEIFDTCFPDTSYAEPVIPETETIYSPQLGYIPHVTNVSKIGVDKSPVATFTSFTSAEDSSRRCHKNDIVLIVKTETDGQKDMDNQAANRKRKSPPQAVTNDNNDKVPNNRKERRKETNRRASAKYRERQDNRKKEQEAKKQELENVYNAAEKKNCVLKANVSLLTAQLIKAIRSSKK